MTRKKSIDTHETQPDLLQGVRVAHFAGVCSLDGCSQAPMDGFIASREMSNPVPRGVAEFHW